MSPLSDEVFGPGHLTFWPTLRMVKVGYSPTPATLLRSCHDLLLASFLLEAVILGVSPQAQGALGWKLRAASLEVLGKAPLLLSCPSFGLGDLVPHRGIMFSPCA